VGQQRRGMGFSPEIVKTPAYQLINQKTL